MAGKISEVVSKNNYSEFNIVTHSLGSYVARLAMQESMFPSQKLMNVFSLASPHNKAPQNINSDLTQLLEKISSYSNPDQVAFFEFDGGLRDFFVGDSLANKFISKNAKDPARDRIGVFQLEQMKNLQGSLNHNSQLYSRAFMN